jgi:hypothetical protein
MVSSLLAKHDKDEKTLGCQIIDMKNNKWISIDVRAVICFVTRARDGIRFSK